MHLIAVWRAFFPGPAPSGQPHFFKGKSTQILKTAYRAHLAKIRAYLPRIESGRFAGFSKNGPFGKPGILRGDQGSDPLFLHDPRIGTGGSSARGIGQVFPGKGVFCIPGPAGRFFGITGILPELFLGF